MNGNARKRAKTIGDFTVETIRSQKLVNEFRQVAAVADEATLKSWFSKKGFEVTEQECRSLLQE